MTTGEHGGYEAAARQYNDCIRTGQIAQAVEWLTEMAEILESEKRYTDALKLGMLTFYFATSGVYAEPVIEDHLAKQICRVVWETGLTLHEQRRAVPRHDPRRHVARAHHVSQGLRVHFRRMRRRQGGGREENAGPIRDGSSSKVNTEAESKKRHGRCSRRSHRARNNSPPMRAADSAAMNEVFTPVYECQYITKE